MNLRPLYKKVNRTAAEVVRLGFEDVIVMYDDERLTGPIGSITVESGDRRVMITYRLRTKGAAAAPCVALLSVWRYSMTSMEPPAKLKNMAEAWRWLRASAPAKEVVR